MGSPQPHPLLPHRGPRQEQSSPGFTLFGIRNGAMETDFPLLLAAAPLKQQRNARFVEPFADFPLLLAAAPLELVFTMEYKSCDGD